MLYIWNIQYCTDNTSILKSEKIENLKKNQDFPGGPVIIVRKHVTGGVLCAVSCLSWALCSLSVHVRWEEQASLSQDRDQRDGMLA